MKYPQIRDSYRKPRKPGHKHYKDGVACVICGQRTVGAWWVQVNHMRGDDEIIRACDKHYKDKQALIDAWQQEANSNV